MADLAELLARVEKAEGPDRELDAAIWDAVHWWPGAGPYASWKAAASAFRWDVRITASLDAALALVERVLPGVWWFTAKGRLRASEPLYGARLLFGADEEIGAAEHEHSAALAAVAALLKALIAKGAQVA